MDYKSVRNLSTMFFDQAEIRNTDPFLWHKREGVYRSQSYGEIAKKYKLSPRHVGKICGQNKLLLIIPCHRVIKTNGELGGFTSVGGINLKRKLLELEK